MRLHSHPQEPCPKLRRRVGGSREWPRENCKGGASLSAFPPATPELVPGSALEKPLQ